MARRFLYLFLFFIVICLYTGVLYSFVFQEQQLPNLSQRITDQTGTLHTSEIEHIVSKLASLEKTKGSQLVVLIIPTTGDETMEQYGIKLAEQWAIGREGVDDGVILIIAKDDRQVRIEVGYGLEGAIPDALANRIINQIIVPQFRSGDFYHGIDQGVDAIISLINGEQLPMPDHSQKESDNNLPLWSKYFVVIVPLGFIIFTFVNYFAKKTLGKVTGMIIVPVLLFVGATILINYIAGILAGLFSLFLFNVPSGGNRGGGRYYSGGGTSWSSGSSSFGGGFSGGGGSFGGGGSSGSW